MHRCNVPRYQDATVQRCQVLRYKDAKVKGVKVQVSDLTTDPLMKQFLTESMCGYLSGSVTLMSVSLMFRYCKGTVSILHAHQCS